MGIDLTKSFKLKLIFSYLFIVLITFGFISYFLSKNLEEIAINDIKSSLITQAKLIDSQVTLDSLKHGDYSGLDSLVKHLSRKSNSRITIVNKSGEVMADSEKTMEEALQMENHGNRPEIFTAFSGAIGAEIRYSNTLKINMLYVALPILGQDKHIEGAIRVSLPLSSVNIVLALIRKTVVMALVFALGLAFVIGSVLANQITKPVYKAINASRRFSKGDFRHKILVDSKDELGELAAALNKMAESLEEKIKEIEIKNQHLVAILESMVEGIMVVDKASNIVSVNNSIEKIFGIPKKGLIGRGFLDVIQNNEIAGIIEETLQKKQFVSREMHVILPLRKIFQINASPVFEKEDVSGCLLVIHDITEIRRLETMRKDFVANVSHELKTPLTSIKGFVETLMEGALEDKENNRRFLQIIHNHANRLDDLVNDLLVLSNLESKDIMLKKYTVDIGEIAGKVLLGFEAKIKDKSIEVKNNLAQGILLNVDSLRMEQVFTNLIDNAIKFNKEKGYIRIHSENAVDSIKIIIEDSGIGIPAKDLPRIFERFYRVDKARSRELGGTGLGLSIVKHIVELHNGNIGVESAEGIGAKFWFSLPKQHS